MGCEALFVRERGAPIHPISQIDPAKSHLFGQAYLHHQRKYAQRELFVLWIVEEVDGADPVIEDIDQIDAHHSLIHHIKHLFAKIVGSHHELLVVGLQIDFIIFPAALLGLEFVKFVVELDMLVAKGRSLDVNFGIFVFFDRALLAACGDKIESVDTDIFALRAALADRMEVGVAKTAPPPPDQLAGQFFGGVWDVAVVEPTLSVR